MGVFTAPGLGRHRLETLFSRRAFCICACSEHLLGWGEWPGPVAGAKMDASLPEATAFISSPSLWTPPAAGS